MNKFNKKNLRRNFFCRKQKSLYAFFFAFLFLFGFSFASNAQCPDDNEQYGMSTAPAPGNTVTLTGCIYNGEYRLVNVVPNSTYAFFTCGDDDFDTRITIYEEGTGIFLGTNDDFCGLQSSIDIVPNVSQIRILIDLYDCTSSTGSTCMILQSTNNTLPAPISLNDECVNGEELTSGVTVSGTSVDATFNAVTDTTCDFPTEGIDETVWYTFTGTGSDATVDIPSASFDTQILIYSGNCGALTCVVGDDDSGVGSLSQATFPTVAGTDYFVLVKGFAGTNGTFDITFSAANDACTGALLQVCGTNAIGNTDSASNADNPGTCDIDLSTAPGLWHEVIGTGETIVVSTDNAATDFDTKLGVFTGVCGALVCEGGNDDGGTGLSSVVIVDSELGTSYFVYVTGFGNSTGTFELSADFAPTCIPATNAVVILAADGTAPSLTAVELDGGSNSVCGTTVSLSSPAQTFDCTDVGAGTTVTLTVTDDDNGLTSDCEVNVSVIDVTPPVPVCTTIATTGAFDLDLNAGGSAALMLGDVLVSATDACGVVPGGTVFMSTFFCADIGPQTVTVTVVDVNGVSGTCQADIVVNDVTAPIAICQAETVQLDANGDVTLLATSVENNSTDACGITSLLISLDGNQANAAASLPFGCTNVGGTTVTLFVTDASGNTGTCTAAITVEDNINPSAICKNAVVSLDDNGEGSIGTDDINDGSNDACGITLLSLNNTDFTCSNVGANGTTLTVMDANGNVSTCAATVTVQDLIPAVIECRQLLSTTTTQGFCSAEDLTILPPFSLFDNCGAENVTFTRTPAVNDFPLGETILNWTGTDANGNTSTCQSLVMVSDGELPTIFSCNAGINFIEEGSCLAQVTVTGTGISDNCGIASVEGIGTFTLPIGIHANPITITDVSGNVTVHDFTIYIYDNINPDFQNCPEETIILQADADGTADYPAQTPVATDNCGVPTITNDLPADGLPMGSNVVTFIAQDNYDNTTECIVNVEVTGGISLHPIADIESSLAEDETTQTIVWNSLNASTFCEICEETSLEGFRYVGTWWGHQYFLANESSLTRDEAVLIAEGYDAHLAVINDAAENAYLTEVLDDEIRSAWIGLMPQLIDEEWTFAWDNGDALDFEAISFEEITAETRIILGNDGTWKEATMEEDKYFLIERPCVDFVQTGPIYTPEVEDDEEELPGVLLRSGDVWLMEGMKLRTH